MVTCVSSLRLVLAKLRIMNTCAKAAGNSRGINICLFLDFKSLRMNTYRKNGEGGPA
jgi:hypothetical protein